MLSRKLTFGNEARERVQNGVNKLYEAVACTLGPGGGTVLYGDPYPTSTKDGVTVAKNVFLSDVEENLGAQIVKVAAMKANEVAGDGTTSCTILTKVFFDVMQRHAAHNRYKKIEYLKEFVELFRDTLKAVKINVAPGSELLNSVASISANDSAIGSVVAELVSELGPDASVYLEPNDNNQTIIDKTLGFSFDCGWESQHYVNNAEAGTVEYIDPVVVIADMYVDKQQFLAPALEILLKSFNNRPIVIVSQGVGEEAKQFINKNKGVAQVATVKGPEIAGMRTQNLEDLAKFLGGVCLTPDFISNLSSIKPAYCGTCEKVVITSEKTTFVNGAKGDEYDSLCNKLEEEIGTTNGDYQEYLRQRLSRLKGIVAKVKIGNGSYSEFLEKRYRFEDSINATRAALKYGIVPGGGVTYIRIGNHILELIKSSKEQNETRYNVISDLVNSLSAITTRILFNYGYSDEEIDNLLKSQALSGISGMNSHTSYDIDTLFWKDAASLKLFDPALVLSTSVEAAATAATIIVTTECLITTDYEQLEKLMRLSTK